MMSARTVKGMFKGLTLAAMFASDIGHWDVPDMREVVLEAWELVEDGLLSLDDFRDFTFTNAVRCMAGTNPRFFEGTVVEKSAAAIIGLA